MSNPIIIRYGRIESTNPENRQIMPQESILGRGVFEAHAQVLPVDGLDGCDTKGSQRRLAGACRSA